MPPPLFARPFTDDEQAAITAGLRAADAFTLRRCQILSASAAGKSPPVIATDLQCSSQTVRNVIRRFNQDGLAVLQAGSSVAHHRPHTAFTPSAQAQLAIVVRRSPRAFGKNQSHWSLALLAEVAYAEGLTGRLVSLEAVRLTLKRMGIPWARAKQWIGSPDPAYTPKKSDATA
jgi:transposase